MTIRFVLVLVVVLALYVVQPLHASQQFAAQEPGDAHPDYELLNQPGPLWLPGMDFSHQNLYGVNLSGANLRQANFDNASLVDGDLSAGLLVLSTWRNADLTRANLRDATLSLSDLRSARLSGADLSNAKLQGTMFANANLDGALLVAGDLRESDLRRASLRSANLNNALLAGANLMDADLTNADLSHANLSSVNLAGADLTNAQFDEVTFDSVTVWPANFDVSTMTVNGPPQKSQPDARSSPDDLSVTLTLMPQLLPWYSQAIRPQDGALVENAQQSELMDVISIGDRVVIFKSVDLAEELTPLIADKMDTIGYNLEHGPLSPLHEQSDPIGSVQRMRELANTYGLRLALGLDHRFALSHGAEMAPYVDSYVMQVQRVQAEPQRVLDFVVPMAEAVRAANPEIETTMQVRTEGDPEEIVALVDSVRKSIDGVVILSSAETSDMAVELVQRLQGVGAATTNDSISGAEPQAVGPSPAVQSTGSQATRPSVITIVLTLLVLGLVVLFVAAMWQDLTIRRRNGRRSS